MAAQRRERRRTCVPAEMMKLVTLIRHRHRVHDLAVSGRAGLHVDDRQRVGLREVRAEHEGEGQGLRRACDCLLRRRIECGIWSKIHWSTPIEQAADHGAGHATATRRVRPAAPRVKDSVSRFRAVSSRTAPRAAETGAKAPAPAARAASAQPMSFFFRFRSG